jgi:predicted methyltransferase
MKTVYLFMVLIISYGCSHRPSGDSPKELPGSLAEAVKSDFRSPDNRQRDRYQHPLETLSFFGLKNNMTVIEVLPGSGYFTEILAFYLAQQGHLLLAVSRMPLRPPRILIENEMKIQDIMLRHPLVQANTKLIPLELPDKRNRLQKESVDMIVTFNTIHNLVAKKSAAQTFKIFYQLLRRGGILGIVQHRVRKENKKVPKSGYMYEHEVIKLATAAGFRLQETSEINANLKDTADYPEGVWVLPPVYRLGDKDQRRFREIGESDRMTLKFIRP